MITYDLSELSKLKTDIEDNEFFLKHLKEKYPDIEFRYSLEKKSLKGKYYSEVVFTNFDNFTLTNNQGYGISCTFSTKETIEYKNKSYNIKIRNMPSSDLSTDEGEILLWSLNWKDASFFIPKAAKIIPLLKQSPKWDKFFPEFKRAIVPILSKYKNYKIKNKEHIPEELINLLTFI